MAPQWWRQRRGEQAEHQVGIWLQRQGLKPVARNWRCRLGEIDLIMQHGDTLVFVEVRCRSRQDFGGALASVDVRKQRRLIAAAGLYLGRHPQRMAGNCRFDVVAVEQDEGGHFAPQWIQNAFYGDE